MGNKNLYRIRGGVLILNSEEWLISVKLSEKVRIVTKINTLFTVKLLLRYNLKIPEGTQ